MSLVGADFAEATSAVMPFVGVDPAGRQTAPLYGRAPVAVGGLDVQGVAIMLDEGLKVIGRVEFDGAAARPTPQQMQTIAVGLVAVNAAGGDLPGPRRAQGEGRFTTAGYPPGRYVVVPAGRGGGAWTLRSAVAGGRDVLNTPFELKKPATGVVISSPTGWARSAAPCAARTACRQRPRAS